MDAAEQGGLEPVIELWVGAKEVGRLAKRLERTSDADSVAVPRDTVWPIEPHTAAKHQILRKYLDAWLPILGPTRRQSCMWMVSPAPENTLAASPDHR